jgi:putative ABC transport system permease protein
MIRNYLMISLRNFKRQKLFALLNMFGLALGIASAILIFLYVTDELQYDAMHPDYEHTYRLGVRFTNADGRIFNNTVAPGFFVKHLRDTRTEVQDGTRIAWIGYPTSLHHKERDKIILSEEIRWAEPHFDKLLAFELLKGNREKMFNDHNSIVISETGARKLSWGRSSP